MVHHELPAPLVEMLEQKPVLEVSVPDHGCGTETANVAGTEFVFRKYFYNGVKYEVIVVEDGLVFAAFNI